MLSGKYNVLSIIGQPLYVSWKTRERPGHIQWSMIFNNNHNSGVLLLNLNINCDTKKSFFNTAVVRHLKEINI